MNICIVTENYIRGGVDTFLWSLIDGWPNSNDKFTIIVNQESLISEKFRLDLNKNVRILYYSNHSTRFTNKLTRQQGENSFKLSSRLSKKLQALWLNQVFFYFLVLSDALRFKNSHYDRLLVVNGGHPGGLSCRSAILGWKFSGKRPLSVLSFHNYFIKPRLTKRIMNFPSEFMLSRSISTLVSVSNDCLNSLVNEKLFKSVNKQVIYNGIPNPELGQEVILPEKSSSNFHCIMMGSFEARKGHHYLLTAFSFVLDSLPNAKLHMYGDGNPQEYKNLVALIQRLKLDDNAFLHNFNSNIMEDLRFSDALLVPSQSYESFGLSIIEAMSFGVPVVATNVGGIPEVLGFYGGSESKTKPGILCERDDPAQFGKAVVSVLTNTKLANEMGQAGRERFLEMFQNTKMSRQYYSLFS